jgi:hypothetical protein
MSNDPSRDKDRAKLRTLLVIFAAVNVLAAGGGALLAVIFRLNAPDAVAAVWKLGAILAVYGVANIVIVLGLLRQVRKKSAS